MALIYHSLPQDLSDPPSPCSSSQDLHHLPESNEFVDISSEDEISEDGRSSVSEVDIASEVIQKHENYSFYYYICFLVHIFFFLRQLFIHTVSGFKRNYLLSNSFTILAFLQSKLFHRFRFDFG